MEEEYTLLLSDNVIKQVFDEFDLMVDSNYSDEDLNKGESVC